MKANQAVYSVRRMCRLLGVTLPAATTRRFPVPPLIENEPTGR